MAVLQGLIDGANEQQQAESWQNLPVHPDSLPSLSGGNYESISPLWLKMSLRRHWVLSVLMIIGVIVAWMITREWMLWGGLLVLLVLFFWGNLAIRRIYYSKKYLLRQKDITYRSGWLWNSVTAVPYNRIQHVEIEQGPIEKWYKLATLEVYTAGKNTSDLSISGLSGETAEKLKDYVLGQVLINKEEE